MKQVDDVSTNITMWLDTARTENWGLRNSVTSCRLEKCMSSGKVWSFRRSLSLSFTVRLLLPLREDVFPEVPGSVMPAPRVTGAKSSFARALGSFSEGVRKSILNASFFSRLALGADSVVSAAEAQSAPIRTRA